MSNTVTPSSRHLLAAVVVVGAAAIVAIAPAPVNAQGPQETVLDGVFTSAQADRGGAVYGMRCGECHEGADVDGPPLTGTPFVDRWREDTLDRLLDFIRTRMPQQAPGSLPDAAYLDVLAHLLQENGFQPGARELTAEIARDTLLVGPSGPQPLPTGALVQIVGCLARNGDDWVVGRAGRPLRVRAGNEITAAEVTEATRSTPGTQAFALQNVEDADIAPTEGQRVIVKGALTPRDRNSRIHVTAAKTIAGGCGG
jgi:hypothetical protein